MTTTEKFRHLYPKLINNIDTSSINCINWSLLPSLKNAVLNHDLVSASYMLAVSVCPGMNFLETALQSHGGNAEMARLLRAHNAPITTAELLDRAREVGGSDLAVALANPPPSSLHYLKPMPAYYFVRDDEFCNVDPPVLRTWQPNGQPPPTPPWEAYSLAQNTHEYVEELWKRLKTMRRDEARELRKYNWKRARLLVQMRALALFWMEETQKRLCAPGGKGRAKDLAAFKREFV